MDNQKRRNKGAVRARAWHKWGGLFLTVFLLMFAVSGIILNHRAMLSSVDLPRQWLPKAYQYKNWNNAAIKGGVRIGGDSVLLFGGSGVWLTNDKLSDFRIFTQGMKSGSDNRYISNIVKTASGEVFASSTFDLYRLDANKSSWIALSSLLQTEERIMDITHLGDSLVVQTRSELFLSMPPYSDFVRQPLALPADKSEQPAISLFRTIWMLHSGELFGLVGRLLVDFLGLLIILLCITGLVLSFYPRIIIRRKKQSVNVDRSKKRLRISLSMHNRVGMVAFWALLLLTTTGMFLRPPLLIPIAGVKHQPIAGTAESNINPWHDKMRNIRYDEYHQYWLIYTADGFYISSDLKAQPRKLHQAPPVGFMGPNVLESLGDSRWIVGSFAGLFCWDSNTGKSYDLLRKQWYNPEKAKGMPDFTYSVSGYLHQSPLGPIVFDYNRGAEPLSPYARISLPQPEELSQGRISLWLTALEVHSGRIYTILPNILVQLFIFLAGVFVLVVLISGRIVYNRFHRKRKW